MKTKVLNAELSFKCCIYSFFHCFFISMYNVFKCYIYCFYVMSYLVKSEYWALIKSSNLKVLQGWQVWIIFCSFLVYVFVSWFYLLTSTWFIDFVYMYIYWFIFSIFSFLICLFFLILLFFFFILIYLFILFTFLFLLYFVVIICYLDWS